MKKLDIFYSIVVLALIAWAYMYFTKTDEVVVVEEAVVTPIVEVVDTLTE